MTNKQESRLADWFREWHFPLRRFLARRRAGSAADIDDIAQEVFLRLLRYNKAELVDSPQAYLYRIAANVSAEWSTRASRRLPHNSQWLNDLADTLDPHDELDRQTQTDDILRAINQLPDRTREILRLHFAENLRREDIALRLNVTGKIVKRDLARAYASLRVSLDPQMLRATSDAARERTL
jgi:RNA polymerase sigma factor (sigma-70 family)